MSSAFGQRAGRGADRLLIKLRETVRAHGGDKSRARDRAGKGQEDCQITGLKVRFLR
ncbi:hypothetical protein MPLSOD_260061 [Mesorhizobium sp. SOD10]|nr:hypothetical protein MPLSOD_260061 [Mesorhizobium sp. SOD10]